MVFIPRTNTHNYKLKLAISSGGYNGMGVNDTYDFSFTAASLRVNDMVTVAEYKNREEDIDGVSVFGSGNSSTGNRLLVEFEKRLAVLSSAQIDILIHGDLDSQKQIALLSVCKCHLFIRDFLVEVLREKVLLFDYQITEVDYITFYRRKREEQEEMNGLSDNSVSKVRQVTFKMLEQAGIIDNIKKRNIEPQLLSNKLIKAIAKENKEWLKIYFMSDLDIEKIEA